MARSSGTGIKGLYQRADGRFRIEIQEPDPTAEPDHKGRRYKSHRALLPKGTKKEEAIMMLAGARQKLQRAVGVAPVEEGVELGELYENYIAYCVDEYPKRLDLRRRVGELLKVALLYGGGSLYRLTIKDLKAEHVEAYAAQRTSGKIAERDAERRGVDRRMSTATTGASPQTVRHDVAVLRHFFRWINRRTPHLTSDRLAALVEAAPQKVMNDRTREATDDEIERITAHLSPSMALIWRAALLTGIRRGPLVTMRKSWINWAADVIRVPAEVQKTSEPLEVYMLPEARAILREACEQSPDACPWVFVRNPRPTQAEIEKARRYGHALKRGEPQPYSLHGVSNALSRAAKSAGVENLRFHDARHTIATRLKRRGVDLQTIGQILGHSARSTQTRRYAHVTDDQVRSALHKLI